MKFIKYLFLLSLAPSVAYGTVTMEVPTPGTVVNVAKKITEQSWGEVAAVALAGLASKERAMAVMEAVQANPIVTAIVVVAICAVIVLNFWWGALLTHQYNSAFLAQEGIAYSLPVSLQAAATSGGLLLGHLFSSAGGYPMGTKEHFVISSLCSIFVLGIVRWMHEWRVEARLQRVAAEEYALRNESLLTTLGKKFR